MFGLSRKERSQRSIDNLCGIQLGLYRELRSLLIKRLPDKEPFIDVQPHAITKLHYAAASIAQYAWLMHATDKADHQTVLDGMHLSVLNDIMKAREYDIPPQQAQYRYSREFEDAWKCYREYLQKILIEKDTDSILALYMIIEDEVFGVTGSAGRIGAEQTSTELLTLVVQVLAFAKKYS